MGKFINTDTDIIYSEDEMRKEFDLQMEIDKQNGNFENISFEEWLDCVVGGNGVFEIVKSI